MSIILGQAPSTLATVIMLVLLVSEGVIAGGMSPKRLSDRFAMVQKIHHHNIFLETADGLSISTFKRSSILQEIRGGGGMSDEEEEEEEEDETNDDGDEDETNEDDDEAVSTKAKETSSGDPLFDISQQFVVIITKLTTETTLALTRAFQAAFQNESDETDTDAAFPSRVWSAIQRILKAVVTKPSPESQTIPDKAGSNEVESVKSDAAIASTPSVSDKVPKLDKPSDKSTSGATSSDFGGYLAQAYAVADTRPKKASKGPATFVGGSLADALQIARSQARLLVVFIPTAQAPKGGTATPTADQQAIQSLLSKKAFSAAQKKVKKDEPYGSYLFWGAKAGSPEAIAALKRLKAKQTNSKGVKTPVLLVAFPKQVFNSAGELKLTPVTIAQHHCSPPPSEESMGAWLKTLRKRHAKEYAVMQLDLREAQLLKERQEGYRESVTLDAERQQRERKEKAERIAKEKADQERIQAIERRRKELLESLPEEPTSGADVVTIALRFTDGRTGQRKFALDAPLEAVFNWVDALFEMERETVLLATMNGQKTFSWQDCGKQTLADAGIGRMTGLRVSQVKSDAEPASTPQAASSTS